MKPHRTDILDLVGASAGDVLGSGGEALVYALDDEHVVRVPHVHPDAEAMLERRVELLAAIAPGARSIPYDVPSVVDRVTVDGRLVALVERRLPGTDLLALLHEGSLDRARRRSLVRSMLDAAASVADIDGTWPAGGTVTGSDESFDDARAWAVAAARRSLGLAGPDFAHIDPVAVSDALPDGEARLCHLDLFAGNVLCDGESVTAIIDFGTLTCTFDRRLDPVAAVVYLDSDITPPADDDDRSVGAEWLDEHGLSPWRAPCERWLAAFWAGAVDDEDLHRWCRRVLL